MKFYRYIYYLFFGWIREWFDPFAPGFTTTLLISLLPVQLLDTILSKSGAYGFAGNSKIILPVIYVISIFCNFIYFFIIYKGKDIFPEFREKSIPSSTRVTAFSYIFVTSAFWIYYLLFLGI